jgi:hypothetical protein
MKGLDTVESLSSSAAWDLNRTMGTLIILVKKIHTSVAGTKSRAFLTKAW